MKYDWHIHSCLSPCADDDMTCNNIVNMALLKGLESIALTDHNSTRQLPVFHQVANRRIHVLYGVELQTREEVHVLGYFQKLEDATALQPWIDEHLTRIPNDPSYFGHQWLVDETDQPLQEYPDLLIDSLDVTLEQAEACVHEHGGAFVLAHVWGRNNSVITQLGFIPQSLRFDGIEIVHPQDRKQVEAMHPWLHDTVWLTSSDAHNLIDIHEAEYTITSDQWTALWRNVI